MNEIIKELARLLRLAADDVIYTANGTRCDCCNHYEDGKCDVGNECYMENLFEWRYEKEVNEILERAEEIE